MLQTVPVTQVGIHLLLEDRCAGDSALQQGPRSTIFCKVCPECAARLYAGLGFPEPGLLLAPQSRASCSWWHGCPKETHVTVSVAACAPRCGAAFLGLCSTCPWPPGTFFVTAEVLACWRLAILLLQGTDAGNGTAFQKSAFAGLCLQSISRMQWLPGPPQPLAPWSRAAALLGGLLLSSSSRCCYSPGQSTCPAARGIPQNPGQGVMCDALCQTSFGPRLLPLSPCMALLILHRNACSSPLHVCTASSFWKTFLGPLQLGAHFLQPHLQCH